MVMVLGFCLVNVICNGNLGGGWVGGWVSEEENCNFGK